MSIAARGTPVGTSLVGSGTIAVTLPLGIVSGDILIITMGLNTSTIPSTPSGLTALDSTNLSASYASYYRICDGTEPSSYSFTVAGSTCAVARAYSGCNASSPINAHGAPNRVTASATTTASSVTTTVNGCLLIFASSTSINNSSLTTTGGWANQVEKNVTSMSSASQDQTQATAGATGSVSETWGGSGNSNAQIIALAPSPPVNTVAPVASGTTHVASTLSVTNGTWTDNGSPVFTYQWQDSADGSTGWANVGAATSSSYVIAVGETGKYLRCVVTDTDADSLATSANSNVLGPITNPSLSTIIGKTGTSGTAVMQKAASGYTQVAGKTGTSATAIDQKGAGSFTKVKGH